MQRWFHIAGQRISCWHMLSSSNIKVASPENCGISPCALCKVGRNASLAGCLDGCVEWCIAWGLVGLEEMKWNHCNALFYESRAQQSRGGNRCLKMKHFSIELQATSSKQGCRCFSNRCQHCWSHFAQVPLKLAFWADSATCHGVGCKNSLSIYLLGCSCVD